MGFQKLEVKSSGSFRVTCLDTQLLQKRRVELGFLPMLLMGYEMSPWITDRELLTLQP